MVDKKVVGTADAKESVRSDDFGEVENFGKEKEKVNE